MAKVPPEKNAEMRYTLQRQFKFVFDVDEDSSSDTEGTITQALMLLNGAVTNNGVRGQPGSALAEVMELPGSDEEQESHCSTCERCRDRHAPTSSSTGSR